MEDTNSEGNDNTAKDNSSLGMSDEDFMNINPDEFEGDEANGLQEREEGEEEVDVEADTETEEDTHSDSEEEDDAQPDEDTQTEADSEEGADEEEFDHTTDEETTDTDTDEDTQETEKVGDVSGLKKILAPFKANGKEMQVDNVDEAIQLMQMGANYTKKMMTLKPNLKIIKALEKNDLLDEAKINNLIDLAKRDPKAITKLIKESGIDPLDIDTKDADDYRPTDHSVTDKEFNLDEAIDEIRGSKFFDKTIEVLGSEWDEGGRNAVVDNPQIVKVINTHIENGIYDQAMSFIEKERALGRMSGVNSADAYERAMQALTKSGAIIVPGKGNDNKDADNNSKKLKESDAESKLKNQKKKLDAKRQKKRKAAAPNKQKSPSKTSPKQDILNMSDSEFMKKYSER